MYQRNHQPEHPSPGVDKLGMISKNILPKLFLILLTLFFSIQIHAQNSAEFYQWTKVKYPSFQGVKKNFEGYGMQILLYHGMSVEDYTQNLENGLLGHVWIRSKDDEINSGEPQYSLIIQRWSYNGICAQKENTLSDQVDTLVKEFGMIKLGNHSSKSIYPYHQRINDEHQTSSLDFTCQKLKGEPGKLFQFGEVCVSCIGEELIMVYLLDQNKKPDHTLWYFSIEFAKFKGFHTN